MHLNDYFELNITTNKTENNYHKSIDPDRIFEMFAFKEENKIISYESLEFIDGKYPKNTKLSDFFLRNLFVNLKKFSENKFESNSEDISFTRINF